MKVSGKIHRGTSIVAAVFMLIFMIVGTGSNILSIISLSKYYETSELLSSVFSLAINAIATLLLILVLFRGKKDSASGILVILTILMPARGVFSSVLRIITAFGMLDSMSRGIAVCLIASGVILFVAHLAGIGFRALIAAECFKPGKITGGKTKAFFVILPIVNVLMIAVSNMVQQLYLVADYGVSQFLIAVLLPTVFTIFTSLGTVLMGVAFSIPVYENKIFDYTM